MTQTKNAVLLALAEHHQPHSDTQKQAFEKLLDIGLPNKKSELYKFTPITSLIEKNVKWDAKSDAQPSESYFYQTEGVRIVTLNGGFYPALSEKTDLVDLKVNQPKEGKNDPFSLLNTAFVPEEIAISSGKTELPIFIYHFTTNGFINSRVDVTVEKSQQINVIEKIIHLGDFDQFVNSYTNFKVAENAIAYHTKVQNYTSNALNHETTVASVARDGKFYNNTHSFEGKTIRNNLNISLKGENCEAFMYGLFLLDKKSHVDNNTTVDHIEPNSYSNELYKGILDEKATGVFNGKIYVRQKAQKTNAFQSNNNILLSEEATLHTKPQLEIWADDVKCSHGCTSGQLDEDAIFYLRARGIDKQSAHYMLLNAFAEDTLEHIKVEEVKEEVSSLISKKLS